VRRTPGTSAPGPILADAAGLRELFSGGRRRSWADPYGIAAAGMGSSGTLLEESAEIGNFAIADLILNPWPFSTNMLSINH
jgi:hypothetical protein